LIKFYSELCAFDANFNSNFETAVTAITYACMKISISTI